MAASSTSVVAQTFSSSTVTPYAFSGYDPIQTDPEDIPSITAYDYGHMFGDPEAEYDA